MKLRRFGNIGELGSLAPNHSPSVAPIWSTDVGGRQRRCRVHRFVGLAHLREAAVHVAAVHRAAHDEVVRAPGVVGAVAIGGEGAGEVGRGEGGHLGAHVDAADVR